MLHFINVLLLLSPVFKEPEERWQRIDSYFLFQHQSLEADFSHFHEKQGKPLYTRFSSFT